MRWEEKKPVITGFRAIKRFALFPIKCKNEYRWLEMCYIFQSEWSVIMQSGWTNEFWMSKEEYKVWNKGCRYARLNSECPYNIDGKCKLRYDAKLDDCGNCFRVEGFHGSKEHYS